MARPDTLLRLAAPAAAASVAAAGVVDAQVAGQAGGRRGLREGAPALHRARRAYLRAEWTGADDRRPEPGLLARLAL